jgi:hypothetical protein
MSSAFQSAHLSNRQRGTLRQIFRHPAGHNIGWRAVLSLAGAVGSAYEQHSGKVAVTIGSRTEYFDPPRHKDISTQASGRLAHHLQRAATACRTRGHRLPDPPPLRDRPGSPGRYPRYSQFVSRKELLVLRCTYNLDVGTRP